MIMTGLSQQQTPYVWVQDRISCQLKVNVAKNRDIFIGKSDHFVNKRVLLNAMMSTSSPFGRRKKSATQTEVRIAIIGLNGVGKSGESCFSMLILLLLLFFFSFLFFSFFLILAKGLSLSLF